MMWFSGRARFSLLSKVSSRTDPGVSRLPQDYALGLACLSILWRRDRIARIERTVRKTRHESKDIKEGSQGGGRHSPHRGGRKITRIIRKMIQKHPRRSCEDVFVLSYIATCSILSAGNTCFTRVIPPCSASTTTFPIAMRFLMIKSATSWATEMVFTPTSS